MLYNDSNATSINDRSISICPDQNSMTICPGANINETVYENLMATIPEAYMCWKYLLLAIFMILAIICVKYIVIFIGISYRKYMKQQKSNRNRRGGSKNYSLLHFIFTKTFFKLAMIFVITILRFIWLLDPHANSKTTIPGALFGRKAQIHEPTTMPLLTVPQLSFILVLILEINTWKQVVDASKHLRRMENTFCNINNLKIALFIFPLFVVIVIILGCSFVGHTVWQNPNSVCHSIWSVYFFTFSLYIICLTIGGFYYAHKLFHMIKFMVISFKHQRKQNQNIHDIGDGITSKKDKYLNKTRRIFKAVVVLSLVGTLLISMFIFRQFVNVCCDKDQIDSNIRYLIYITVIHFSEFGLLCAILNSVKVIDYESKSHQSGTHIQLFSKTTGIASSNPGNSEEVVSITNPLNNERNKNMANNHVMRM